MEETSGEGNGCTRRKDVRRHAKFEHRLTELVEERRQTLATLHDGI